jgi:putative membrane protein
MGKPQEHLANERTFLAWIRTGIALMGFGFVIVKFALFLRQLSFLLGRNDLPAPKGYSAVVGVIMVLLGVLISGLSYLQYRGTMRKLEQDAYRPAVTLPLALTLAMVAGGIVLVLYLWTNI